MTEKGYKIVEQKKFGFRPTDKQIDEIPGIKDATISKIMDEFEQYLLLVLDGDPSKRDRVGDTLELKVLAEKFSAGEFVVIDGVRYTKNEESGAFEKGYYKCTWPLNTLKIQPENVFYCVGDPAKMIAEIKRKLKNQLPKEIALGV